MNIRSLTYGVALVACVVPLVGCPLPPNNNGNQNSANSNSNANGNTNTNRNLNGSAPTIESALVGSWFNAATREGLEFTAAGEVRYLDVGPQGELRLMPAISYRGMTQTVRSATDGILETRAMQRLRVHQDQNRIFELLGTFDTHDEYVISSDSMNLTIVTELYGVGDGVARDQMYRRAALGEIVSSPHDMFFDIDGGATSADAQRVTIDSSGRLDAYAEANALNTFRLVVTNGVGTYALTPGGEDRVRLLLQINTRELAAFETISGNIVVSEVTDAETTGTVNATIRSLADRGDQRTLTGSFGIKRE